MPKFKKKNCSEALLKVCHTCFWKTMLWRQKLPLNFFTSFMQCRLHSSSFSFSWINVFCFRKFFLLPVILNIAAIVFRVRELVLVEMTAPSRWLVLKMLLKMLFSSLDGVWRAKSKLWVPFVWWFTSGFCIFSGFWSGICCLSCLWLFILFSLYRLVLVYCSVSFDSWLLAVSSVLGQQRVPCLAGKLRQSKPKLRIYYFFLFPKLLFIVSRKEQSKTEESCIYKIFWIRCCNSHYKDLIWMRIPCVTFYVLYTVLK